MKFVENYGKLILDFGFLALQSAIIGLIPLVLVATSSRVLDGDALAFFVQAWVVFNFANLAVFGSLEASIPRLSNGGLEVKNLSLLYLTALAIVLMTWGIFLGLSNHPMGISDFLGILIAILGYGIHAIMRGFLIARALWRHLAFVTLVQAAATVVTLFAFAWNAEVTVGSFFGALAAGYFALIVTGLSFGITPAFRSGQRLGAMSEIRVLVSFALSSAMANILPALPTIIGGLVGLPTSDLLVLATAPFLSRVFISLANSITPWFLERYIKPASASMRSLSIHAGILFLPSILATGYMALDGENFLEMYLGIPLTVSASSVVALSLSEGILGGLTAFRTMDLASSRWGNQLKSWTAGILMFIIFFAIPSSVSAISLSFALLAACSTTLLIQSLLSLKRG